MASTSAIRVFKDLKGLKEHIEKNHNNFVIEGRKDAKTYQGATFYNNRIVDPTDSKKYPLIVRIEDILITGDMQDPDTKDDKKDPDAGNRHVAKFTLTTPNAGDFGQFIYIVDEIYGEWCKKQIDEENVEAGTKINPIVQRKYSFKHPDKDKRNKDKPIHTLRIKLDFSKYSDKHFQAFLRGKLKTEIYDYSTKYVDDSKIIRYKLAEVDGKPVDETNVHKFITRGSRIVEGRIHIESTINSTFGFSMLAD